MKARRTFLATLGTTAILALAGGAMAVPGAGDTAKAAVGKPAPDFTLEDADGKSYALSSYKGKIVVLQWINPQCPICRGCFERGAVAQMSKDLKAASPQVVHLAINSTHFMTAKDSAKYLAHNKVDVPGLDDADGTVGRLYGAKTTPHLFVIDQEGVLRYNGAIDDAQINPDATEHTNFAVNAVRQIVAGETVSPDTTKPYGCPVKYAKGEGEGKGYGKDKGKDKDKGTTGGG